MEERTEKKGRSVQVLQFNDTSSCKLEMAFWQPDITKDEIIPLISLTPPYDAYKGHTGQIEAGAKVFNYEKKISISLGGLVFPLIKSLKNYIDTYEDTNIAVYTSSMEGRKELHLVLNEKQNTLKVTSFNKEGKILNKVIFNFSFEDPNFQSTFIDSLGSKEQEEYFYPVRLELFLRFLEKSIDVILKDKSTISFGGYYSAKSQGVTYNTQSSSDDEDNLPFAKTGIKKRFKRSTPTKDAPVETNVSLSPDEVFEGDN